MSKAWDLRKLSAIARQEFRRYFAASILGLSVDVGLLMLLTQAFSLPYLLANSFAFLSGSAVVYLASAHWAFQKRRFGNAIFESFLFVLIGVVGLAINDAMLWISVEILVWSLLPAKFLAAGFSFLTNFALRKVVLFN
ncbi:MAG: GtrA family protein [Rhodospirillaceae bacterium]|jgi:putative flippase GtrA|nr:GtrA family protein [Rhodospirillaceae bacterium]MBT3490966.1 GtrA family protein [Rhodospirillaceae bacterium]MBT3780982.1 GtrA family protein [Rhodospirillaceae bacterium]MBT3976301.1 GtrA family protein [Rhodospirillaceae bacterium]MBT4168575.1 GtrA family protein [Rhodospirillaceae bacterium]